MKADGAMYVNINVWHFKPKPGCGNDIPVELRKMDLVDHWLLA